MSDERHYEKSFQVAVTITVTAKEPLALVSQRVIETLVRTHLGKLDRMSLGGVNAPSACVSSTWATVEEVVPIPEPIIRPEPIILGRKVGDSLVITDDAKLLLETWLRESGHLELAFRDGIGGPTLTRVAEDLLASWHKEQHRPTDHKETLARHGIKEE